MKKQYKLLPVIVCLLSVSVMACEKNTENSFIDTAVSETIEETELETDTASAPIVLEEDELTKNMRYLKNGDTKPLVGLSFGDKIDYDKYHVTGWVDGMMYYRFRDGSYEDKNFLFAGKGGGFSGLYAFSGDFFGIALWEDSLEKLTDILGEADMTEEKRNGKKVVWARWQFETASLAVKIKDEKVCEAKYFANGAIADAKMKTETDFEADCKAEGQSAKAVYHWANWAAYGEKDDEYAAYTPYDDDYDADKVDIFLQDYLQAQGIYREEPDGVFYNQNGDLFVEYYNNAENGQYCFILHLWDEYWLDRDNDIRAYRDAVYCTAHKVDEDDKTGYALYGQDADRHTKRERMYDIWGNEMAKVSYEYVPQMPFPLITEERNLTESFLPARMLRNQKTWFYKEEAQFDADGKFLGNIVDERWDHDNMYFPYSCRAIYDANGRLKTIEEELQTDDSDEDYTGWNEKFDYSGQMTFDYYDDGIVKRADYIRSSYTHGTWDSTGEILYDEKGRMIYNDYYVTHGYDAGIYLYDGDSEMPWCVLSWCSNMPGIEEVWLFLPES
ncbi:MAG: hypothetical protein K2N89_01250 [Lachnospiraceae bacterium]|nr:hypothetical protein [Lachnospiraceae bacterium]